MEWLNLHTSVLDSEAFAIAEDAHCGTWLRLMRYCIGQENGGRIKGAAAWSDRQWIMICRVSKAAIDVSCGLWKFDGEDFIVWGYPREKQREVQAKREGGRLGGLRSAQARAQHRPSSPSSSASLSAATEGERKENGKEGEGKEGKPSSLQAVIDYAKELNLPREEAEKFADHFAANGWRQAGRTPMRDWRASLRNWARRAGDFGKNSSVKHATIEPFNPDKPHAHTGGLPVVN